jgi:uncharacterized protein
MSGEKDLNILLKTLQPNLHNGEYVFCLLPENLSIPANHLVMFFKEEEGDTVIIKKELADSLQLPYTIVLAWITLTVHSSLEAVGLTAAFSNALASAGIGCNVVSGFYHDHLFVDFREANTAMNVLQDLSKKEAFK